MRFSPLHLLSLLPLAALTSSLHADPALTIYNQDFAVVRDTVPLDLQAGTTEVRFTETTAHLEPDSVVLRDPSGKIPFQVLEQNYRADPVSQGLLLSLFEGKTIDFLLPGNASGTTPATVKGRIIRSGYLPPSSLNPSGNSPYQNQFGYNNQGTTHTEPIIEVDGKLRFTLPGQPIFPALADDTILKPTLDWKIQSDQPAKLDAELAYLTGGMTWQADYSVVAPEQGDQISLVGLVTIDNQSGKNFPDAKIKLMAGDVNKIPPNNPTISFGNTRRRNEMSSQGPGVTEKSFDEYHLYSLPLPTTLHDRETKQVEFIHAEGITSRVSYVYDGLKIDQSRYQGWTYDTIRNQEEYGTEFDPKVSVMREFQNSEANHLGLPLPKGRVRFYRRDGDGQLEFTGENTIDHTPRDETLRIYTGNAFDLTGERHQTNYHDDRGQRNLDESFEITLRNHKKEPVEVRVVEHLYRSTNWEITDSTEPSKKTDAQTVSFTLQLKPDEEKPLTYTVHYSW